MTSVSLPQFEQQLTPLRDRQGRSIRYLRLSVTSACPMRCVYCRPHGSTIKSDTELQCDEIVVMVRRLVQHHGVSKVRITGGEPTSRPDLVRVIEQLSGIPGLHDLGMTTNGLTLSRYAARLAGAGLHRVNISLDSLDRRTFTQMTGIDGLQNVLDGIDAAAAEGLTPIKLNCVVLRGRNDEQLPDLVRFAAERDVEIRFIELMPMGPLASQWSQRYVSVDQMRQRLSETVTRWINLGIGRASANRYRVLLNDGQEATIGFIAAMSCPFCRNCDRIRITSDAQVYPCLMDSPAAHLLGAIRPTFNPRRFDQLLAEALEDKSSQHGKSGTSIMTHIGG